MWLLVLIIIGLIIFGLLTYARWHVGSLEKLGIGVVPRDHFLLGSAMKSYEQPGGLLDVEWMKKYGSVFGVYNGRDPYIVVCDAEIIRCITTKDADSFNGIRTDGYEDPLMAEMLEVLEGSKWKFVRGMSMAVMSNAARLRAAHPAMSASIKDFVAGIKLDLKENGMDGRLEKYCVNEGLFNMLTDLVARSQFAINIGKSDASNRFVQIVTEVLNAPAAEAPWISNYGCVFPFLQNFLPNTLINPKPFQEFCVVMKQLLEARAKQNDAEGRSRDAPPRDFLDTVLEWHNSLNSPEYLKHNITENTIWAIGLTMFIAGQAQISLIVAGLMYSLACDSKLQKKCEEEVDKAFSNRDTLSHDSLVSELPFVTACVTEASRLYPFVYRTERVCTKDWEHEERGVRIKKGQVAIISIWGANRNPEYFEDPDEFKPERFMVGNKKLHSYAFTTFGFGVRSCPAKRMSMEIMVLIVAYMLKEFRFLKREDSQLKFVASGPAFVESEPVYLDVELREKMEE